MPILQIARLAQRGMLRGAIELRQIAQPTQDRGRTRHSLLIHPTPGNPGFAGRWPIRVKTT
jgi:hypothetical protein